jgi:3-oxoacyl-[acyl-carrier protein] reductase
MSMDLGMYGRTYVVTGGSRGLGLATARVLLDEGANLVISARDETNLAAVVSELSEHGRDRVVGIASDLGNAAAAERLVAASVARFGRLDGALINGATPPVGSALETSEALWREAFETIFLGGLRMARATAAAMTTADDELKGTGGSIAFVLSTSARQPFPGLSVSNGLRPGQAMLVRELADEFGPRGIRINGLMPGRIATDRTFEADARSGQPEMVRRRNE